MIDSYSAEDIATAKQNMYDGASTTPDNRYSMPSYVVRRVDGWAPSVSYTLPEAKKRLVEMMVEYPKEQWEIARGGGTDRVCWKHSMSNPDYVLCQEVERASAQRNTPPERKWELENFNRRAKREDQMLVLLVQHFDATPFMAKED